jgi:hypothetical protein
MPELLTRTVCILCLMEVIAFFRLQLDGRYLFLCTKAKFEFVKSE